MKRHERLRYLFYNWTRWLFTAVGHDIYHEDGFKPNWISFVMYGLFVCFFINATYTVIYYDWFTRLNVLEFFALVAEVTYLFYIPKKKKIIKFPP